MTRPATQSTEYPPQRLTEIEWMQALNIGRQCTVPQERRDDIMRAKEAKR
jgi:hypothetical protein